MSRLPSLIQRKPLTARRAAVIIAIYTLVVTLVGGIAGWLLDRRDFHSIGNGLWWSVQTVTTVGYGDVTPHNVAGRVVGVFVIVSGVAFLTVITASVTAALVESARSRLGIDRHQDLTARLDEISRRLATLEARGEPPPAGSGASEQQH